MVLVIAALALLAIATLRAGPDRTVTGTVTEQQPHRVCVADATGRDVCVHVDSPQVLVDSAVGDCVRLRYSADRTLESLDPVSDGCGAP
jgi:hypothetical protein